MTISDPHIECNEHAALLQNEIDRLRAKNIELNEKLDEFEALHICDCCEALHQDCVDAGGHMQCPSCTEVANLRRQS